MERTDAEEVRNHKVVSLGLVRAPGKGGSIIQPVVWRGHACLRDCLQEGGLVENKAASSRSEFVIVPLIFFHQTKYAMVSGGQGCRQTRLCHV